MDDDKRKDAANRYFDTLLEEGATTPVDADGMVMKLPPWYNEELYNRARDFFRENIFAIFAGQLAGLLCVLSVPSILNIVIYTNQSSTTKTSYRRYIATLFHANAWYDYELKPDSKSWQSLTMVRKGHICSSKYAQKGNAGFITQKDMALTQFGFMGFAMLKPHLLGVQVNQANHEAFVHFWRVIGYMIGIEDRFNLCSDSWETTKPRLELCLSKVYRPNLQQPSQSFIDMITPLINGMWCFNPMLDVDAFLYFTRLLSGCQGYGYLTSELRMLKDSPVENLNALNWYSRFLLFFQYLVHTFLLNFVAMRWYFNFQIVASNFIIAWFPFLAIYKFGFKAAYVSLKFPKIKSKNQ